MTRTHGIPAIRCSATKRDGTPCRKWAHPGAAVCTMHGAKAKQVRAKASQRLTMAELHANDARHPWQVVLDATHIADTLMRDAEQQLRGGEPLTAGQVDRLVEITRFTHHLAKTALDTRAHEHLAEAFQRDGRLEGELVAEAVTAVALKLVDDLGFDPVRRLRVLTWVSEAAAAALGDKPLPDPPVADVTLGTFAPLAAGTTRTGGAGASPADSGPGEDAIVDAELVDEPAEPGAATEPTTEVATETATEAAEPPSTDLAVVRPTHNPVAPGTVPGWGRRRNQNPMTRVIAPWRD